MPDKPLQSRDFMINVANYLADLYGKKCNTSKIGEVSRSTIHIPSRHKMVHSSPTKKSRGKNCYFCKGFYFFLFVEFC
jgi:hypothetical protein